MSQRTRRAGTTGRVETLSAAQEPFRARKTTTDRSGGFQAVPRLTEKAWQAQVLTLARMFGWSWWHDVATNAPRACPHCKEPLNLPRNDPGWPDLFLVRDDVLIVTELKTDRNNPTPDQWAWLRALSRVRRILVEVWKPRDVERITRVLR